MCFCFFFVLMYYDLEKEIHYIAKYKVAIYFALPCFFSSSFRVMPRHIDIAEREPFNMLHQRNIVEREKEHSALVFSKQRQYVAHIFCKFRFQLEESYTWINSGPIYIEVLC